MDRFIACKTKQAKQANFNLKSNMDRFIGGDFKHN